MKPERKARERKKFEPFYADILALSKKKKITLAAARNELIKKEAKQKKH